MSQGQQLSVEQLAIIKQETEKLLDTGVVMDKKTSKELNDIINNCEKIISKELTSDTSKNDLLWSEYLKEIGKYAPLINDYEYNFILTKQEYKTIRNIFYKELSYNRNTIFQALVVKDNFFLELEGGDTVENLFKNVVDGLSIRITIRDIKRISDLMSLHEVKGLNKESEAFASVFKKIGDIMRIFEHFYELANDLGNRASAWTATGVDMESKENDKSSETSDIVKKD